MGQVTKRGKNANVTEELMQWGMPQLRDLPWRQTQDPWHVLVSEVMLQQTNVPRVLPKFSRFIDLFSTPLACANASLGEMLVEWQGLGYPRRCKNLHLAAQAIVNEHGGVVPRSLDALLALPGVGQYTARAVLAFAFDDDVAVVDTNVARVLARVTGNVLNARDSQTLADDWLPHGFSRDWNQVIMDFGAVVCNARKPHCESCPIATTCGWRGRGEDPAKTSALTSKPQATFAGSDRQARGKLMKSVTIGAVHRGQLCTVMGLSDVERAQRLADALVHEGLIEEVADVGLEPFYRMP